MVKINFDKKYNKLDIKTLNWNVPEDYISRVVVFIENVFARLEIDEHMKEKGCYSLSIDSMLKLLVYAKI